MSRVVSISFIVWFRECISSHKSASLKKFDDCSRHAKRANKIAIGNNFLEEQAQSFELMAHAEHSLGNNIVATEEFAKAAEIYQQLDQPEKMRKSNCYAAIAKGKPARINS